jgi:hypothetical protein
MRVLTEKKGRVTTIIINRPEVRNAGRAGFSVPGRT